MAHGGRIGYRIATMWTTVILLIAAMLPSKFKVNLTIGSEGNFIDNIQGIHKLKKRDKPTTTIPHCPNGKDSKPEFCSSVQSSDCYNSTISELCCATCNNISNRWREGCEYGDRLDDCNTNDTGSACYQEEFAHLCCETCHLISVDYGQPGCEYGDRDEDCYDVYWEDCQDASVADVCCASCHFLEQTDCMDGDTDEECYFIDPADCYDAATQKNCCQSCTWYARPFKPDCLFGNKEDNCDQLSRRQCYDPEVKERCCATCDYMKASVQECPYGDRIDSCDNLQPTDCHGNKTAQHQCCLTCSELLKIGNVVITSSTRGIRITNSSTKATTVTTTSTRTTTVSTIHVKASMSTTLPAKTTTSQPMTQPSRNQTQTIITTERAASGTDASDCIDTNIEECSSVSKKDCYVEETRTRCCETCTERKINIPVLGCDYGDRGDCLNIDIWDCYNANKRFLCCETCYNRTYTPIPPECEFGDTQDCSQIDRSQCYTSWIKDHCCETCYKWKNESMPDCLYGDKIMGCSVNKCSTYSSTTQAQCCETCANDILYSTKKPTSTIKQTTTHTTTKPTVSHATSSTTTGSSTQVTTTFISTPTVTTPPSRETTVTSHPKGNTSTTVSRSVETTTVTPDVYKTTTTSGQQKTSGLTFRTTRTVVTSAETKPSSSEKSVPIPSGKTMDAEQTKVDLPAVVGGAVGALILLVVIVVLFLLYRRKQPSEPSKGLIQHQILQGPDNLEMIHQDNMRPNDDNESVYDMIPDDDVGQTRVRQTFSSFKCPAKKEEEGSLHYQTPDIVQDTSDIDKESAGAPSVYDTIPDTFHAKGRPLSEVSQDGSMKYAIPHKPKTTHCAKSNNFLQPPHPPWDSRPAYKDPPGVNLNTLPKVIQPGQYKRSPVHYRRSHVLGDRPSSVVSEASSKGSQEMGSPAKEKKKPIHYRRSNSCRNSLDEVKDTKGKNNTVVLVKQKEVKGGDKFTPQSLNGSKEYYVNGAMNLRDQNIRFSTGSSSDAISCSSSVNSSDELNQAPTNRCQSAHNAEYFQPKRHPRKVDKQKYVKNHVTPVKVTPDSVNTNTQNRHLEKQENFSIEEQEQRRSAIEVLDAILRTHDIIGSEEEGYLVARKSRELPDDTYQNMALNDKEKDGTPKQEPSNKTGKGLVIGDHVYDLVEDITPARF